MVMSALLQAERPQPDGELVVSVIIPTLNRSPLLRDVIESLFSQTLDPKRFEIVVVDNASTDNTPDMMRELQARSPCRLVYHRLSQDHGPARARNEGVRLARGEFLAFTDSDCRVDREWLARGTAAFRDEVGFVTGSVLHKPEQRVRFFSGTFNPVTQEHPTYPTCNIFYRRKVFSDMGGMDEKLCFSTFLDNKPTECADTDLAWRVKKHGYTNLFLPELVVYHEVGLKSPWKWVVDPFRLYVVPLLVKKHPEFRTRLLYGRIFFDKENALFYLAVAGLLLGVVGHWGFLSLAMPYPVWVALVLRQNLVPHKLPKLMLQILLLALRRAVVCAGLIYGSIRFRCLVL